jgi:hypothetical protein
MSIPVSVDFASTPDPRAFTGNVTLGNPINITCTLTAKYKRRLKLHLRCDDGSKSKLTARLDTTSQTLTGSFRVGHRHPRRAKFSLMRAPLGATPFALTNAGLAPLCIDESVLGRPCNPAVGPEGFLTCRIGNRPFTGSQEFFAFPGDSVTVNAFVCYEKCLTWTVNLYPFGPLIRGGTSCLPSDFTPGPPSLAGGGSAPIPPAAFRPATSCCQLASSCFGYADQVGVTDQLCMQAGGTSSRGIACGAVTGHCGGR